MRKISTEERRILTIMAGLVSPELRSQLFSDIENSSINEASTPSRIFFDIAGYDRPPYEGEDSFGVEGRVTDADGVELQVDLSADQNGRLLELELVRYKEGSVIAPVWSTFVIRSGK